MQGGAVSVEANLIAKRARMKTGKRFSYREDTTASTSDPSISNLTKTMEKMMERLNMFERAQSRENQFASQNRNQNQNRILGETNLKTYQETLIKRLDLLFHKTM